MTPKKISIEDAHVVVVDESEESLETTLSNLKRMGFRHIDVAPGGVEGLSKIIEDTRLLIARIHNKNKSHMNGIDLLRIVRDAQNFERKAVQEIASSRKNLKLIFDARDSNRPFGVVHMIQRKPELQDDDGLNWDEKEKTGEWDTPGEYTVDNNWVDPPDDQRIERTIHIPDTLSVVMTARELQQDDLEKILTFGGAEFVRKPLNEAEFRFAVQKALIEASVEEGVRVKYGSWVESLQISGRELIREFGMEKKSLSEAPFQVRHSNPLAEFCAEQYKDADIRPFLNANPNWTTDRSAADISARWKIVFANLLLANFKYCRELYAQQYGIEKPDSIDDKILICDLGLGSGRTLKGLRKKGIPEKSLVAVANIRLFELQSMLEASLLSDRKSEEDTALNQFLKFFSVEFLNQKGMDGLLDVQIGKPEHEARLRKLLQEVSVDEICENKTLLLPGMFNQEKEEVVSDEVVHLFEEYKADPRAFLQAYFEPALTDSSKGNLKPFARVHGKHLLPLDFRDFGESLSEEQILGATYDCRALSHLPDPGFFNTTLAVLARLVPGAIYIGDGVIQSYSGHIRGGELMEILQLFEKKGNPGEYRAWWLGDDDGPLTAVVQRGVKNEKTGEYEFWDVEGDGPYNFDTYLRGAEMIPMDQFYKKWPKLALKNLVIRELRQRFWDEAMKEMMSRNRSIEYVRTWLSDKMRIPRELASQLPDWDESTQQGVRIFDYLDVFLNTAYENEDFKRHVADDEAAGLEKWMKRKMNGKKSGWVIKLADEFMGLRENIVARQQMEDEKREKEEDESEEQDPGEGTASAAS